jgi:hypothetical protein
MRTLTGFLTDRIESLPENQAQAMPGVDGGGNWSAPGRRIASRRGPIGGEGKRAKAGAGIVDDLAKVPRSISTLEH